MHRHHVLILTRVSVSGPGAGSPTCVKSVDPPYTVNGAVQTAVRLFVAPSDPHTEQCQEERTLVNDFKHTIVNTCASKLPTQTQSPANVNFSLAPSPINILQLERELAFYNHPDNIFLMQGFKRGFSLQYEGPRVASESKNLKSARLHPDIVKQNIQNEIDLERIAGPFKERPIQTLRVSPIGLVPKKSSDKFRLIHHLSYPAGESLNDYIDPDNCSVQYTSFDKAVEMIQALGKNCELFKMDIKSAFRLLPVMPKDFDQLGFKFEDMYYFDKCLPFGCAISCNLFNRFADFLQFVVQREANSTNLIHYLDDFLGGGQSGTGQCKQLMEIFSYCMDRLNVPLADDKTEGPVTKICFLGLFLDSEQMMVSIPVSKIQEIMLTINTILHKDRCKLREMQSLIGMLNFACRAIAPGRPFCRRLINATKGIEKPHHHLRITKGMKNDLEMWKIFFQNFNGIQCFPDRCWSTNEEVQLFTDSAQGFGFGIYFAGKWGSGKWPDNWHTKGYTGDITVLELFPIVAALFMWAEQLQNKRLRFRCDNMSVCHILNKMTSKSDLVMVLLRNLTIKCLRFNVVLRAEHVPGKQNTITDALSRFQMDRFRRLAPDAEPTPCTIPAQLWQIFEEELLA